MHADGVWRSFRTFAQRVEQCHSARVLRDLKIDATLNSFSVELSTKALLESQYVTHEPNGNCAIACCELFLFRDLPLPGKLQQCHSRKMKGVTPCSNNISNSTVTFFYQGPGTGLTPIEATGKPEKAPEANLLNGDRCESNYYGPLCYCN